MNTLPEHKHIQVIQSWYEPALRTLSKILAKKEENLRKINRDIKNAAVSRDEYVEALLKDHRTLYHSHASEIISSLYRAGKIRYLGKFIQMNVRDGAA
ncbi:MULTISPECIES: hypothetical protein [unclassified Acinetobacter]|uniref:hypothetical protein n=1 Tax=unclassified Acinetobacter TaxID=196816 RepID=UPI00190C5E0B|nr:MULTISPECIES: hypothetical protein [unclassified Acinetobacter]MBK0062173.1 hypothetical protein [Acinetobacter sp. S55]MBK0065977.1 hypothetical protein [Acinetobacter sp. S54]